MPAQQDQSPVLLSKLANHWFNIGLIICAVLAMVYYLWLGFISLDYLFAWNAQESQYIFNALTWSGPDLYSWLLGIQGFALNLPIWRVISSLGGLVFALCFYFLLRQEHISPKVIVLGLLIFLGLPVTQESFFSLGADLWSLSLCAFGVYLLFKDLKHRLLILSGIFLLAFILSCKLIYLSFFGLIFLCLSSEGPKKLIIPLILLILALIYYFGFNEQLFSMHWFKANIAYLLASWSILIVLVGIIISLPLSIFNFQHPAPVLALVSMVVAIFEFGLGAQYSADWLVVYFALTWIICLSVDHALKKPIKAFKTYLLVFFVFYPVILFVVGNKSFVHYHRDKAYIQDTRDLIDKLIASKQRFYSLDYSWNLITKQEPAKTSPECIKEQCYQYILLPSGAQLSLWVDPELLNKNYFALKKINLFQGLGSLYKTKRLNYQPSQYRDREYRNLDPNDLTVSF